MERRSPSQVRPISNQKQVQILVMQDLPPIYCTTADIPPAPHRLHERTSLHQVAQVLVLALQPPFYDIPPCPVISQASCYAERENKRAIKLRLREPTKELDDRLNRRGDLRYT